MMAAHPFLRVVACESRRRCPVGFAADSLMDWSHMMENQNDQVLVTRKTELTSAQKAGYLFAGLLGGAGCAILASLCNIDAPYRSDCTKFALIGLGIRIALSVIGYIAMLPFTAMLY